MPGDFASVWIFRSFPELPEGSEGLGRRLGSPEAEHLQTAVLFSPRRSVKRGGTVPLVAQGIHVRKIVEEGAAMRWAPEQHR